MSCILYEQCYDAPNLHHYFWGMKELPFEFSLEIRSPRRGRSLETHLQHLKPLLELRPAFASIANHKGSPSSKYFALALKSRFNLEVVPHIIGNELSPAEIEDTLIGFNYTGIRKVMALRGDRKSNGTKYKNRYAHANEIVKHIRDFNDRYGTSFESGVAGYPDVHQSADSQTTDLSFLKNKIDAGAAFVITQMCIDNKPFFDFLDRCRAIGINIPVIPGLKLISPASNLNQYTNKFNVSIPAGFVPGLFLLPHWLQPYY